MEDFDADSHISRIYDLNEGGKGVEPALTCERCGNAFNTARHLESHVENYHEGYDSCGVCSFRGTRFDLYNISIGCEITEVEAQNIQNVSRADKDVELWKDAEAGDVKESMKENCMNERVQGLGEPEFVIAEEMAKDSFLNERVKDKFDGFSERETDVDVVSPHEGKEKCCFCSYVGNKGDLCDHIANVCEILGYGKEIDVCSEVDNDIDTLEEVKSFDEHITNEDEEEAVAEDERTEIAILDSELKR